MSEVDTTLPTDIFREAESEASHIFEMMIQRFDKLITHRIEMPENMTAKEYAGNIIRFFDILVYKYESGAHKVSGQHLRIRSDKLEWYELNCENCFYKLARHNPEIALEYYIQSAMLGIDFGLLPISDNIELYALLIEAMGPEANVMRDCTHEELEMLIDRLGAETMLEHCGAEAQERVKEIVGNPLVKCAAKVT